MTDPIENETAKTIDEVLEISEIKPASKKSEIVVLEPNDTEPEDDIPAQLLSDHEETREKLRVLYAQGSSALTTLIAVAEDTESPRAFEVVSQLLRNLADISEKLLDAHQKTENVKRTRVLSKPVQQGPNIHNQILFTGTTDELQTLLEDMAGRDGSND